MLSDVVAHGVTAEELDLAKNRMIADAVYAQDNQATLARWYGAALATGETVDMVREWPEAIRAVTADAGARRGAQMAQPQSLGHRLSGQQPSRRGETHVSMMAPALPGSIVRRAVVALLALPLLAAPALATTIERVVSPGGIEAWLVHEPAVPMIAIDFRLRRRSRAGCRRQGRDGTWSLRCSTRAPATSTPRPFTRALSARRSSSASQAERDTLRGTLRTLTENKDEAFDYLRLAVTQPRFDPIAMSK